VRQVQQVQQVQQVRQVRQVRTPAHKKTGLGRKAVRKPPFGYW